MKTLLTGEPLSWQLTNAQRAALGLAPVEAHWQLTEVPGGLLSSCETYIYLDGLQVMRVISHGSYDEDYYEECCVAAQLTEDGRMAPAKPGGKSVPLTAANLHKRRHTGISLRFQRMTDAGVIEVKDHDARRELLYERFNRPVNISDLAAWLEARINRCPAGGTVV